jgi:hypothetical protein
MGRKGRGWEFLGLQKLCEDKPVCHRCAPERFNLEDASLRCSLGDVSRTIYPLLWGGGGKGYACRGLEAGRLYLMRSMSGVMCANFIILLRVAVVIIHCLYPHAVQGSDTMVRDDSLSKLTQGKTFRDILFGDTSSRHQRN